MGLLTNDLLSILMKVALPWMPQEIMATVQKGKGYAGKDWHARGRVNAIGAITDSKLFNVCLFDRYMNADVFHAWVVQELLPDTPKNPVVVLDNATFHKRDDTLQAMEEAGHTVAFLSPYSLDLNPIEKKGTG
ncbi:MAG: transposase [Maribacter sp.]|nr:MAG: transposase [Maribacter sp.]